MASLPLMSELCVFVKENLSRKKKFLGEHSTTEDFLKITLHKLKELRTPF